MDTSRPIYVPASSIPSYKVHESWKNFTNLVRNDIVDSGTGWNGAFTWLFTSSGELIIEGSGELSGSPAYEHRSSIKKISIGNGITSLGNWAFDGYSNVTSIYIPSTVTSLSKGAFYRCYKLNEINIPDGITTINDYTFENCISLTSIQLPESITSIGFNAFYNCSNLNEINIPSSIKNIGPSAFYGCKSTMAINISSIETWLNIEFTNPCYAKNLYLNDELVTNLVIPNTIAEIKNFAFYDCDNLKDLIIPSNVTSIGSMAFYGCENIERISCDCVTPPTIKGDSFYGINNNIPVSVIYPSLAKYQVADYWKNFTNFQPQPIAITINQYGSGTYCSDCALDFSNVNGLKAYVATGYNSHTGVITLTRVMTAKAGVGLFVMGEPGEYNVPVMESTDDNSLNMLVGTLERTPVNGTSDDGLYYNYRYTIKQDSNVPLFYRIDDGYTLGAGKAYLQIPVAWIPTTSESRVISLKIDEENTTDIEEEEKNPVEQIYYDIMGRKVKHIRKGMIYIINGKKTIIN